jgi:hypothetical protein
MAVEVNTRVLERGGESPPREVMHVVGTRPNFVTIGPVTAVARVLAGAPAPSGAEVYA